MAVPMPRPARRRVESNIIVKGEKGEHEAGNNTAAQETASRECRHFRKDGWLW
jgi:hypothetical protein